MRMRRIIDEAKALLSVLSVGIAFIPLFPSGASSQQRWVRTYGGGGRDQGYSVRQTTDGGYIVAGTTGSFGAGEYDVWLIKTNASGDSLWTKTYGGASFDEGYSVQQTSDGGYIIAGRTASFGAGVEDVYLIKTNASGDTLWTRTYGNPYSDLGYSVQQTSDGGYIIAGQSGPSSYWVYLIKTNASGDTLWTRRYGSFAHGQSVRQTSDGGYIIAGNTYSQGAGWDDVYLVKTNAFGDTLWTRTYGGTMYDCSFSVQQTSDGGYIIAGRTWSFGAGGFDVYLIKTNASGDTLWTRTYGGTSWDEGYSVQLTQDGGYIITGYTHNGANNDLWLIKTNANGDTLWTRTYGGTSGEVGYSVQLTSDGGYVVAGWTTTPSAAYDVYLIKTDANGSSGVETPVRPLDGSTVRQLKATPNPFTSFATLPGHEAERFALYDISGRQVGIFRGDRVGEGLAPGVYFLKPEGRNGRPLRVVKLR